MKPAGAWFELSSVAAALVIAMLLVMWARQPDASCTLPIEPHRQLVLSRDTDREHVATDRSSADRTARRFMLSAAGTSPDQQTRFADCEEALVQQLALTHGLPADVFRSHPTDDQ